MQKTNLIPGVSGAGLKGFRVQKSIFYENTFENPKIVAGNSLRSPKEEKSETLYVARRKKSRKLST